LRSARPRRYHQPSTCSMIRKNSDTRRDPASIVRCSPLLEGGDQTSGSIHKRTHLVKTRAGAMAAGNRAAKAGDQSRTRVSRPLPTATALTARRASVSTPSSRVAQGQTSQQSGTPAPVFSDAISPTDLRSGSPSGRTDAPSPARGRRET
jgi:hypothetical protein